MGRTKGSLSKLPQKKVQNTLNDIASSLSPLPFSSLGYGGAGANQLLTTLKNSRWQFISNNRHLIGNTWVTNPIAKRYIEIPVEDAFRGGIIIKSMELEGDNMNKFMNHFNYNYLMPYKEAKILTRAYGGGGLVINTGGKSTEEFEISKIKQGAPISFIPFNLWELNYYGDYDHELYTIEYPEEQNRTEIKPPFSIDDEHKIYMYNNQKISNSRIIKFKGQTAIPEIRQRLHGWGFSVLEHIIQALNQFLKSNEACFELLDQATTEIFKINDLNASILQDGGESILAYLAAQAKFKSFKKSIVMDAQDDFLIRSADMSAQSQAGNFFLIYLAAALGMPMTKIYGISAAGFSTGQEDIETYNGNIETFREECKLDLINVILPIALQQYFGFVPDDISVEFKSLRVQTTEQIQAEKNNKFERLKYLFEKGVIDREHFVDQCNNSSICDLPIYVSGFPAPSLEELKLTRTDTDDNDEKKVNGIGSFLKNTFLGK